jgi:hypothetical protein
VTKNKYNSGQALLVVLLSLSVVLIIVLYIVSRSITDVTLSIKDEESLRAFSAAEAGIERALIAGTNSGSLSDANFSATVSNFAESSDEVVYPIGLKSGHVATFWFNRPSEPRFAGNSLKFCWGDENTSSSTAETPALEVTIFYTTVANDLTTLRLARTTLDPNASRLSSNNFSNATNSVCTIDQQKFQFQASMNLPAGFMEFAKVKMLYNTQDVHYLGLDVSATGSVLPSQGLKVDSSGSYGDANRRIELYALHPAPPTVFENAIFSSSGIVK